MKRYIPHPRRKHTRFIILPSLKHLRMPPILLLFLIKRSYFIQHLTDPPIIMKILIKMICPFINILTVQIHIPTPVIHPFEFFQLFWFVELVEIDWTTAFAIYRRRYR